LCGIRTIAVLITVQDANVFCARTSSTEDIALMKAQSNPG